MLFEDKIPVAEQTNGICEMLGLDHLYMANEGKVVVIDEQGTAKDVDEMMK